MVFAGGDACPSTEPFQPFDHKAIVVLDKDELDVSALRLACLWARWTARREESEGSDSIDPARIQMLIDSARVSLKAATVIKGDHTKARTAIDQATQHLDGLVNDLKGRSRSSSWRSPRRAEQPAAAGSFTGTLPRR
jgi:hypothetical protein